jgi:hypothetical protein
VGEQVEVPVYRVGLGGLDATCDRSCSIDLIANGMLSYATSCVTTCLNR